MPKALQDSPRLRGHTKEKLIQLQKKWKTIGRVPDKYSDEVWNRFRDACNAFFDKRKAAEAGKAGSRRNSLSCS